GNLHAFAFELLQECVYALHLESEAVENRALVRNRRRCRRAAPAAGGGKVDGYPFIGCGQKRAGNGTIPPSVFSGAEHFDVPGTGVQTVLLACDKIVDVVNGWGFGSCGIIYEFQSETIRQIDELRLWCRLNPCGRQFFARRIEVLCPNPEMI